MTEPVCHHAQTEELALVTHLANRGGPFSFGNGSCQLVGLLARRCNRSSLLLPLWLGGAGWLTYLVLTLPRQLSVNNELLTLRWWWRVKAVSVAEIIDVRHSRSHLTICTADKQYRLSFFSPNAARNY